MGVRGIAEQADVLARSMQQHNKYFVTGTYGHFAVSCYEGEELVDVAEGFLLEDTAEDRAAELNEALWMKQREQLMGADPLQARIKALEVLALNLVGYITNSGLLEQNPFVRDRNKAIVDTAMKILDKRG